MEVDSAKPVIGILGAVMLAILVSCARTLVDKPDTSPKRVAIEAFLCGAITYTFICFAQYMEWHSSIYGFIGGVVGLLGSVTIRAILKRVINKKVDE